MARLDRRKSALTQMPRPDDRSELANAIALGPSPTNALLEFFLQNQNNPGLCIDVFERVAAQADARSHWVYRLMSQAYEATGQLSASHFMRTQANQLEPENDSWNARALSLSNGAFAFVADAASLNTAQSIDAAPLVDDYQFVDNAEYQAQKILAATHANAALFDFVLRMHQSDPARCVDVFERVAGSLPITQYWTFYNMALAYRAIGDARASFLMAAFGEKVEPQAPSWHLYQIMYHYYLSKNQNIEANIIALRQFDRTPENPVAESSKILELLEQKAPGCGPVDNHRSTASIHTKLVIEASIVQFAEPKLLGPMPLALLGLRDLKKRSAIRVTEVKDATVIIYNNSILVCDSGGCLIPQFCIAVSPQALYEKYLRLELESQLIKNQIVECAVILKDEFSSKNLCHFLLDYMTRLEVYREAGVNVAAASLITDAFSEPFMQTIAEAFGAGPVIPTGQLLSLCVKNLYISDNCTTSFQHPGHLALPWMIDVIQKRFRNITDHVERTAVRIYISRGDANIRRVVNEAEIESELWARGFISIQASHMEFSEQVALFGRASHVVSAHGAGLTNIVFCPKGCEVLELFHPIANNPCYAVLAAGCGLNYTALTGFDGDSSDPIYNDPILPEHERLHVGGRGEMNGRNIKIPIDRLIPWLRNIV